jgi:hypothetical protein
VQCVGVLKQAGLVEAVGLDAAHVVWLHRQQLRHELAQLLLELAADAVELEGCTRGRLGWSAVTVLSRLLGSDAQQTNNVFQLMI